MNDQSEKRAQDQGPISQEIESEDASQSSEQRREAKICAGLGTGVAVIGALTGAVCPLCYFVAPGLIAAGAVRYLQSRRGH